MKNDFTSTKELALANNNTEAKFANILTDLSNIRASGVDLFSEACPDVLHGEAEDFVYGINVAASAVAHIAAPEDYERSNRFLKSAGLDDLDVVLKTRGLDLGAEVLHEDVRIGRVAARAAAAEDVLLDGIDLARDEALRKIALGNLVGGQKIGLG